MDTAPLGDDSSNNDELSRPLLEEEEAAAEEDDSFHDEIPRIDDGSTHDFRRRAMREQSLRASQIFRSTRRRRSSMRRRQSRRRLNDASFGESVSDMASSVADFCVDVKDALVDEVEEVREAFVDQLHQHNEGRNHCQAFLQMSMTRTMCLPPSQAQRAWRQVRRSTGRRNLTTAGSDNDDDGEEQDDLMDHDGLLVSETNGFQDNDDGRPQGALANGEDVSQPQHDTSQSSNKEKNACIGYLYLVGAVLSLSSVVPVSKLMHGVVPCLGEYWRLTTTSLVLFPMAFRYIIIILTMKKKKKRGQSGRGPCGGLGDEMTMDTVPWSWANVLTLAIGLVGYSSMGVAFGLALQYTSVGNALIFANSQSILLWLGKLFVGRRIILVEGLGIVVVLSGAILCATDPFVARHYTNAPYLTLYGDGLALLAGMGGVLYLVSANAMKERVDVLVSMSMHMFLSSFLVWAFLVWGLQESLSLSRDANHGLFGWIQWSSSNDDAAGATTTLPLLVLELYIVLVCSIFGTVAYIQSIRYLEEHNHFIVSVGCLLEPLLATVMAYALGVGSLPGLLGWMGNLLVVAGSIAVIYPTAYRSSNEVSESSSSSNGEQ